MSKRIWLGLVLLAAVQVAFGQNCDNIVSDEANILGGRATGAVEEAAKTINAQGGDARVVTVGQLSGTPETFFHTRVADCRSWQSATAGIKNNLVVFFVSTNPKKLAIFYGAEMANILGSSANAIKMQYMAPAFKDGDWMRGFVQGETQVGMRIHAFNEAALHPTQTTTTVQNEATDLSGLWTAMYWTLGIGFVTFLAWFLLYIRGNSRKQREAITAAQQDALQTAARVADMIERLKNQYNESKALGGAVDDKIGAVNLVSEQFARMGNSESTNPATTGLSADQYTTIANAYQRLMDQLITLQRDNKPSASASRAAYAPSPKSKSTYEYFGTSQSRPYTPPPPSQAPAPQPTSTHTTTNTTVFVDNSPAYVPIIVEEPVYRQREPDPEPVYSSSYSSRSSRSDDSDSGSSSSYSSDSSSSYDSGSSSDYSSSDSSSSDSGSSSDF